MKKCMIGAALTLLPLTVAAAPRPVHKSSSPSKHAPSPPVLYDFEGARLGMSIAEWKALSPNIPTWMQSDQDTSQVASCSSDPFEGEKSDYRVTVDSLEAKAGIVRCRYLTKWHDRITPATLTLAGGGTHSVAYSFYNGQLYRIEVSASDNLAGDVMEALEHKWGAPTSQHSVASHNGFGGPVTQIIETWMNPASSIKVESPAGEVDNMQITYESAAASEVERKLKAARLLTNAI